MMPEDLKELLRAFNDHAVNYLVVGGYAFGVHAEPRAAKDLDIFIRSDEENSQSVFRAQAQYGAPLEGLSQSMSVSKLPRESPLDRQPSMSCGLAKLTNIKICGDFRCFTNVSD